jgi:hypothetical protein
LLAASTRGQCAIPDRRLKSQQHLRSSCERGKLTLSVPGIDGSNPVRSSGESANFRFRCVGAISRPLLLRRGTIEGCLSGGTPHAGRWLESISSTGDPYKPDYSDRSGAGRRAARETEECRWIGGNADDDHSQKNSFTVLTRATIQLALGRLARDVTSCLNKHRFCNAQ